MKFYTTTTTPFGLKVAVFTAELGLSNKLEPVLIDP
jgi:glutathione S-transferase